MNFLNPLARTRFSNGVAKVGIIFKLPNFFAKIFEILFSSLSLFKNFSLRTTVRFSNGIAKVQLKF